MGASSSAARWHALAREVNKEHFDVLVLAACASEKGQSQPWENWKQRLWLQWRRQLSIRTSTLASGPSQLDLE